MDAAHTPFAPGKALIHIDRVRTMAASPSLIVCFVPCVLLHHHATNHLSIPCMQNFNSPSPLLLQGDEASTAFWRAHNPSAIQMVEAHFAKHEGALACNQSCETPGLCLHPTRETLFCLNSHCHSLCSAGVPTAFVCANYACQAPTTDATEVRRQLENDGSGPPKLQAITMPGM